MAFHADRRQGGAGGSHVVSQADSGRRGGDQELILPEAHGGADKFRALWSLESWLASLCARF